MPKPKNTKKIAVTETPSTDDLAKKIDESAAKIQVNTDSSEQSTSGAPEIISSKKTSNTDESNNEALAEKPIAETPTDQNTTAPELADESVTNLDVEDGASSDDLDFAEQEALLEESNDMPTQEEDIVALEPATSLNTQKTVGELAENSEAESENPENEFADSETTAAVEDIVSKESDEILQTEDEVRDQMEADYQNKAPAKRPSRLKELFQNPALKWGLLTGLFLLLSTAIVLPNSRYAVLNASGVRVKSSVTVQDKQTQLPLKNVKVILQGQEQSTNDEGIVVFERLKQGNSQLKIEKRGFATLDRQVVLGWGSNPLPPDGLEAVGNIFVFNARDYLTDLPIVGAEASSGDSSAKANEKGEIRLVVDQYDGDVKVKITAPGLRDEDIIFGAQDKNTREVKMVTSRPNIFVSTRSGDFDVYKIDIDGKNEQVLLAATGKERDDLDLVSNPYENVAGLISTREGRRNRSGYILSGLYIVEADGSEPVRIAESERIRIIDWQDKYLIYVLISEGQSAADPNRSQLKSYNHDTGEIKNLANANYFNDIAVFNGEVYYSPSSYAVNVDTVKFYRVKPDNSGQQVILDKEIWNIIRTSYDTIAFTVDSSWYEVKNSGSATLLQTAPTSQRTRIYRDSPNKTQSIWVDERDGKGVLILRSNSDGQEKVLVTGSGLGQPLRWLSDTVVSYRVITPQETADYVVNINSGEPKKIKDVTNTGTAETFRN
ncbi:MAG: hypothetical protein M3Q79_02770 [bacterium]|nr:hypothetical protein [bacterium]